MHVDSIKTRPTYGQKLNKKSCPKEIQGVFFDLKKLDYKITVEEYRVHLNVPHNEGIVHRRYIVI